MKYLTMPAVLVAGLGGAPTPLAPPFAQPQFHFVKAGATDYRPTVNVEGTEVVFERTETGVTKLFIGNLATGAVRQFVDINGSSRADWCWDRSGGGRPRSGPIAFSSSEGVFRFDVGATSARKLAGTENMIYPAWYPDCKFLAVDVADKNVQLPGRKHLNAKVDAATGTVVIAQLANDSVWAGFPSVNQVNPGIVAFAGQFRGGSAYYNQNLNYSWVSGPPVTGGQPVAPFDRKAPSGAGFLSQFQARTGWWSPDGKWFAFESNRSCDNVSGATYAIFIQDAAGARPAMQVTSCDFNAQHPKWFYADANGARLVAAMAKLPEEATHIATLDVSAFVRGR